METIFISIAAQDDEELKYTIDWAFDNAEYPERVFVGVALTAMNKKTLKDLKTRAINNKNVDYIFTKQKRNNFATLGIGQGRSKAANLYNDQDYMLQVDCHTFLDTSWDIKLISMFEEAKEEIGGNIVLTAIPPRYRYCCTKHNKPLKDDLDSRYPYYETSKFFVHAVPKWSEASIKEFNLDKFLPTAKVSPAFVFGNKEFAKNPGIHKQAIFYDEDFTQSVNLFGRNFAFVFPNVEDFPVRHLDSNGIVKGHERYFFLKYLNAENNDKMHKILRQRYFDFIKDSNNANSISKYKKYSKVDPIKGCFTNNAVPIPKSFRLEES